MERIEVLISKLNEQFLQKASFEQMLFTLQLLQNELTTHQQGSRTLGTSKVSVVLPTVMNVDSSQYEKYAPKPVEKPLPQEIKEKVLVDNESVSIVQENGQLDMVFDPLVEIPTLSHQIRNKQGGQPESLNDKLKQGKTELVEVLKETPIKDLRKAIGINDRFLFINDLFRGDEVMYERSIKTINSFNIYPEAEYWISRELKTKLGWDTELPVVLQFDQLVKRRFS
ncbi:MAG TPA: hypothetical protein VJ111_14205 [Chitinophagaceae bacterium]|nr:hypothetical protein [Chitinophagaceae bacterium]